MTAPPGNRLHFLLLNQFYPPDRAPTGRLLQEVATVLAGRGHAVTVVCSRRSYPDGRDLGPGGTLEGVNIERIAGTALDPRTAIGRVAGYLRYLGLALMRALRGDARPDLVVAMTTPPYLGIVAALSARLRGVRHAHWMMDVFPDALWAHQVSPPGALVRALLEGAARIQFRGASLVVTLGPHMQARVERYVRGRTTVVSVPLWSNEAPPGGEHEVQRIRAAQGWGVDDVVLLYSGNMGLGHSFRDFLEAARRLGPHGGPVWAFAGRGAREVEVERFRSQHPELRIERLPYVEDDAVAARLAAADVHLVSLRAGWSGVMVPSKLQAAFAVGRPVLFVGPPDNEVAAWIRESAGGWVVEEGDVEALLQAVSETSDRAERARRGAAALQYAQLHFDPARNRSWIADLLEQCASAGTAGR
jgi:glycosyltransferase involved in cell wall biosynthesis